MRLTSTKRNMNSWNLLLSRSERTTKRMLIVVVFSACLNFMCPIIENGFLMFIYSSAHPILWINCVFNVALVVFVVIAIAESAIALNGWFGKVNLSHRKMHADNKHWCRSRFFDALDYSPIDDTHFGIYFFVFRYTIFHVQKTTKISEQTRERREQRRFLGLSNEFGRNSVHIPIVFLSLWIPSPSHGGSEQNLWLPHFRCNDITRHTQAVPQTSHAKTCTKSANAFLIFVVYRRCRWKKRRIMRASKKLKRTEIKIQTSEWTVLETK